MHIKKLSLFKLSLDLFLLLMQLDTFHYFLFKKTLSEKQIYCDFIKTLNQLYHARKHLPNCIEFIKGKWQYM